MRPARGASATALVLALACAGSAHAKVSLQGVGLMAVGWTDNVLSQPANPMPGMAGMESDWLFELRPSLILSAGTPRAVERLAYVFDATLFSSHSEANSYQNRLEWAGFFIPSKRVELLMSASVSEGRLNTFNLTSPSQTASIAPLPAGGTTFVGGTAQELLTFEFDPHWRFVQSAGFNLYIPLDPALTPDTFEVDTHWIVERSFRRDALGLDLRVDWAEYTAVNGPTIDLTGMPIPNGVISPTRAQIINALTARWRHDFGHWWNTEADLGATIVVPASGSGSPIWQPAALAAVRYLHPYAQLELTYQHAVLPNTIVGQTFAVDSATLRGGVPLGAKTGLVFAASGGYSYGQTIDFTTNATVSTVQDVLADATLAWAPRREFSAYLRYSFFYQIGNAGDVQALPTFRRQVIMLGLTGTFPGEAAATVPSRQALRVDKSDMPGIPEPHSQPVAPQ